MEQVNGGHECETLGRFVKKHCSYGTTKDTNKSAKCIQSRFFKHIVTPSDSLTNLALQYHVTAEVIRHENKLWNNDTLFLRDFVLVPVTPGNESLIGSCCEIVTGKDQVVVPCWYSKGSCNSKYGNELIGRSMCGNMGRASPLAAAQRTEDPIEILKKYDANIAKLKVDVEKMMINAGFLHVMDEHSPFQLVERKGSNTSMGSRRRVSVDETGPPGSPVLITRSHNQARVIQDSLEKNERANDDLFQL